MPKFRKKPVVIEAYQFTHKMIEDKLFDNIPLPEGIRITQSSYNPKNRTIQNYVVRVNTLEGEAYKIQEGDWIIKGVKGEFYPVKPNIFEATYEPVEPRLMEECPYCHGQGDQLGDIKEDCSHCDGTGKKPSVREEGSGK
jgi:hypothetical protein